MDVFPYQLFRPLALVFAITSLITFFYLYKKNKNKPKEWKKKLIIIEVIVFLLLIAIGIFWGGAFSGFLSLPQFVHTMGPGPGPHLPLSGAMKFFSNMSNFEQVEDIASDPNEVMTPIKRSEPKTIEFNITAQEVLGEVSSGSTFNYWTYDKKVPGSFLRVRQGDTVKINLHNHESSIHTHSIDLHSVNGPGGGATVLQVSPGETKTFTFKAMNPGIYVYHCASLPSVAAHMTHGQYGLILVEPEEGLPLVDKEFYLMQGELYTFGNLGEKGLLAFDAQAMLDEEPNYVVFNGRVGGLNEKMEAKVGDTVRMYVGNGGVSLVSSFHVIGEIFDTVYPEGAIGEGSVIYKNVQSTVIPAGGATIVEFKLDYPGNYIIVDHSLARTEKGALGILKVTGKADEGIYSPQPKPSQAMKEH